MTRVTAHLAERAVPYSTFPHRATATAAAEAHALGVGEDDIVKTVVLDTYAGHVLLALPASRRVDLDLARAATGDPSAHLATEDEIERDFPDVELGAMPPIGSMFGAPLFVDPDVLRHDVVYFPAGTRTDSVRTRPADLFRHEEPRIVKVSAEA